MYRQPTIPARSSSPPHLRSSSTALSHELVELRLRRFARTIRDKPNWREKVRDPSIVARWTREVVEHDRTMVEQFWGGERRYDEGAGEKQWPPDPITDAQLAYLFDELRYLASQRDELTGISVSVSASRHGKRSMADCEYQETTIPMVYESSRLILPTLKTSLKSLAERLEDVPDDRRTGTLAQTSKC